MIAAFHGTLGGFPFPRPSLAVSFALRLSSLPRVPSRQGTSLPALCWAHSLQLLPPSIRGPPSPRLSSSPHCHRRLHCMVLVAPSHLRLSLISLLVIYTFGYNILWRLFHPVSLCGSPRPPQTCPLPSLLGLLHTMTLTRKPGTAPLVLESSPSLAPPLGAAAVPTGCVHSTPSLSRVPLLQAMVQ